MLCERCGNAGRYCSLMTKYLEVLFFAMQKGKDAFVDCSGFDEPSYHGIKGVAA